MIPGSTTITPQGRRTRRALLWVGALVVGLNVVVFVANAFTTGGSVSGPAGSTFVTTPTGAAALAGTLERLGSEVIRARTSLDDFPLRPDMTVALVEVGESAYTPAELEALDEFVAAGGRLVVVGRAAMVAAFVPDSSEWRTSGSSSADFTVPSPVGTVLLSSFGSFRRSSADERLLVDDHGAVLGVSRAHGAGTLLWLADGEPFRNSGIGRASNGAAAVAMLGPGRPVVFDELRHGFSDEGGLWQALPGGFRRSILLGSVVVLLALLAYGRRFGPPHDTARRLGPSRGEYFEAMAGLLGRARATAEATDILRAEALRLLSRRGGPEADLTHVATAAGMGPTETAAVLGSGTEPDDLLGADQALSILTKELR